MTALIASLSILFFLFGLGKSGAVQAGRNALVTSRETLAALRDPDLDDDGREARVRRASLVLFRTFFSILFRSLMAFAISLTPILAGVALKLTTWDKVISFLSRWDVLIGTTVIAGLACWWLLRPKPSRDTNYSLPDRLLHRIAFSSPTFQLSMADMEKLVFGKSYERVAAKKPIFVTSLPRAGTTILLEALHRLPLTCTHTYRDMPFVLSPILWSKLSKGFRRQATLAERAHGDGIQIGYDSPEAFEEIFWRAFWPEKYHADRIDLSTEKDIRTEAQRFFEDHMKKIIWLKNPEGMVEGRYLSKNNANISRIDLILKMLPDARILVVVRDPVSHALSLHRQHLNFMKMHKEDPFVRKYMGDIGHYEFGQLHRPISFPGTEAMLAGRDPMTPDYWVAYWIAAFRHLGKYQDSATFVLYDEFCRSPRERLEALCKKLDLQTDGMLDQAASILKPPKTVEPLPGMDVRLMETARALHQEIAAAAGNLGEKRIGPDGLTRA
ncbi:MAG: sulfotransferase [Thermodesulfobacteriota bacterium]